MHRRALRAPLVVKLVGANLGMLAVVAGVAWLAMINWWPSWVVLAVAVVAGMVHMGLVYIALQPLHGIEEVAVRVWRGDFGARVSGSPVSDTDLNRVGVTLNLLLDGLAADRARMRQIAEEVIRSSDEERAALAFELHESLAQQLAGLMFELSAASRDSQEPEIASRLSRLRDTAEGILEELRTLSAAISERPLPVAGPERLDAPELSVPIEPDTAA